MRTEKEINADLETLLAAYREKSHTLNAAEISEHNAKVRSLRKELSTLYTGGAKNCPSCGGAVIGVKRRDGDIKKSQAPVYEVGCGTELDIRAQGFTPEMAIRNWNEGILVVK